MICAMKEKMHSGRGLEDAKLRQGRQFCNRRGFIVGSLVAGAGVVGCRTARAAGGTDENLSVLISDLHVGGANPALSYTHERLSRAIDEILAMSPRPKRVVCFGDVALSYGLAADYAASKPILQRIVSAGIDLHLTMGNHDKRVNFLREWPEYAAKPLVPGRVTQVVSLGSADLVLLDTLKGSDSRADNDMGPVEGTIDPAQLSWFEEFVAHAKRPFFVGSHQFRDLYLDSRPKPFARAAKSPYFTGWIYGHDHSWCPDVRVASWGEHLIVPTLALPSTGLWGDIGYVVFRTTPDGAVAELRQSDFYFQTPTAHEPRPRYWDVRTEENQGKSMRFAFVVVAHRQVQIEAGADDALQDRL